jgi:hypothetical protein
MEPTPVPGRIGISSAADALGSVAGCDQRREPNEITAELPSADVPEKIADGVLAPKKWARLI